MKIYANTRRVRLEDKEDFTSGGYNDLEIEVELSSEYENLNNYVTFGNIAVPVINNKVKTPTLNAGICKIGVYGYESEDKLILRYSPMSVDVYVKKGSFSSRTAQQATPTPTEFEKCVDELRKLLYQAVITDGSVTAEKIANDAVTSDKIESGAVTGNKLSPDIKAEISSKAKKTDIPKSISKLINDTDFKEYVQITDETTANSYISENGTKHKALSGSNFYLAYFPNEVSVEHTSKYSKAGKVKKTGEENEYLIMYINGIAIRGSEILFDDNGEVDLTFNADNDNFNYGGTDSYRVIIGKPQVSDGFEISSDWDSTKGSEPKGDCLLGDKSSEDKSYSLHIKRTADSSECTVFSAVQFQKYERSGLSMKWVTKDTQIMSIDFKVAMPNNNSKFKGLYFISANDTLLLSANTDLADKLETIETALNDCVKKNEEPKLIGEITFDGSQKEQAYQFDFSEPFSKIYIFCEDLTSQSANTANIYLSLLGNKTLSLAGNGFIGNNGAKRNGIFTIEHLGKFVFGRSDNAWLDTSTFSKVIAVDNYSYIGISFDDVIPSSGKVSIYYV